MTSGQQMQPYLRWLLVCLINAVLTHAIALSKSHLLKKTAQRNAPQMLHLLGSFRPKLDKIDFRGSCTKFLHIPKTGGTSIDSTNFHLHTPVFNSLMKDTYDRIMASGFWNETGLWKVTEGDLFDASHSSMFVYLPFMLINSASYKWLHVDDSQPSALSTCQDLHTPPHLDPTVDQYFRSSCATFCAVRDPLDRYISGYKMHEIGDCDSVSFEVSAKLHLANLKQHPFVTDCHFTKQVMFVYGANSKAESTHTYCKDVIHTEALSTEFTALMRKYGHKNVTLSSKKLMEDSDCSLTRHNISASIKQAIYEYYKSDFEAFGYLEPV